MLLLPALKKRVRIGSGSEKNCTNLPTSNVFQAHINFLAWDSIWSTRECSEISVEHLFFKVKLWWRRGHLDEGSIERLHNGHVEDGGGGDGEREKFGVPSQ